MKNYERITEDPIFDGMVRDSHDLRYRIAGGFVKYGDAILDIGCGTGYGRKILTKEPEKSLDPPIANYLGLDKNPPPGKGLFYTDLESGDGMGKNAHRIPSFDIAVGLEIIEHLNDTGVTNLVALVKKAKKYIVISTPVIANSNPYHKQQFTEEDIRRLIIDKEWQEHGFLLQDGTYGIFIFKRI